MIVSLRHAGSTALFKADSSLGFAHLISETLRYPLTHTLYKIGVFHFLAY